MSSRAEPAPAEPVDGGLCVVIEVNSADLRIGAVNDALDLAELTAPDGTRFVLCGPITGDLRDEAERRGATTLAASSRIFARSTLPLYAADVLRWIWRLRRLRADIVHLNYPGYGPSLACAAWLMGIPIVARAGPYTPTNPANRWVGGYAANCRAQASELLASPLASRVVVTGDLFRPSRLAPSVESRPIPPRVPGLPRALFLGQLVERKGLHILIEAMAQIAAPCELLLVGGDWTAPGYPRDLQRQAELLGVAHRIRFENHRPDVGALLRDADVFVLPSFSEARPRSIIEAMSLGVPVVATATGGIPSLVEDGETGLLVPPGDPHALAGALGRVVASAELRGRLGSEGRRRVERDCRADRTARAYVQLYRRLLAARTHATTPAPGRLET